MKVLLLLLVLGALGLWPFVLLRRPWAIRVWQRFKVVVLVYVLVLVVVTLYSLFFRFDQIYG